MLASCQPPEPQLLAPHAVPSAWATWLQPDCGVQPSLVHGLPSSQSKPPLPLQTPNAQTSPELQSLPSLQALVLNVVVQPSAGSQLSVVQGLLSLQLAAAPPAHVPPAHASPTVHALPSEHTAAVLAWLQPLAGSQLSVVHGLPSSQETAPSATHAPS